MSAIKSVFKDSPQIIVKQIKEMFEVVIDWETANRYSIHDVDNNEVGYAAEKSKGILHNIVRNIMRSHRSIEMDVWDRDRNHILRGRRPWYFFFSDLNITDSTGKLIGDIKTRFGFLKRKYDLSDSNGVVFAKIESYRWRLWTFRVLDEAGQDIGVISKRWGGVLKEVFTDADMFTIDFSKHPWTPEQKSILLYACLSIDLDFFEDNSGSVLGILTD